MNLSNKEVFCPHLMKDQFRFSSSNGNAEINKLEITLGSIPLANQADRILSKIKFKPLRRFLNHVISELIKTYEEFCPQELSMKVM